MAKPSTSRLLVVGIGCVLLAEACKQEPTRTLAAEAPSLCGMPVKDTHLVELERGPGLPVIQVSGPIGSLRFDNMDSTATKTCAFELRGPSVTPEGVFTRYGDKDASRVRFTPVSPGRLRVDYTVPGRSYGLISVEPPVEAPANPTRFEHAGLAYRLTGAALLRTEDNQPIIRSLGPAGRIEFENPSQEPAHISFQVTNSSDRLSRPVLSGLTPGRVARRGKLGLHVEGDLKAFAKASLALEPRPLAKPWSFAFGGDIKGELGTFLQLLEQVRLKHDPLFLVAAGDYTRNSLPQELEAYTTRTAELPLPVYPIKGNHELRAQGYQHYPRLFGPDRLALTVGDALFVLLDSNDYLRQGDATGFSLGEQQLAWLDAQLAAHADRALKFVGLHAPPHPLHGASLRPDYPSNLLPTEADKLFALASKHRVSYVLSGHAHLYARAVQNGTVYLTSGGGGAKLWSHNALEGFDIDTRKHLMVLTVEAAGVQEHRVMLPRSDRP